MFVFNGYWFETLHRGVIELEILRWSIKLKIINKFCFQNLMGANAIYVQYLLYFLSLVLCFKKGFIKYIVDYD